MPRSRFSDVTLRLLPGDLQAHERKTAEETGSSASVSGPAFPSIGQPATGKTPAGGKPPAPPHPGAYRSSFLDASAADAQASSDVRFGEGRSTTAPVVR